MLETQEAWILSLGLEDLLEVVALVVQLLSHVWLFAIQWTAAHQASLSFTISQSLLKLMFIELMMPSNHLILCLPFLLLPSVFPSIRVFSTELAFRIKWPKYWRFSFSISLSSEYSELISFSVDWFDLLAIQGVLNSLLPLKRKWQLPPVFLPGESRGRRSLVVYSP